MPIYENECRKCGATGTYWETVANHSKSPRCTACGGRTKQIVSAVRGFGDFEAYQSPVDGREVRGRNARREDLKRNGCREYEGTDVELREAQKIRAARDKQIEARLDDEINKTIGELDASNKLTRVGDRADAPPDDSGMRTY
jgi:putative FmdB family regulatory protein